MTKGVFLKTHKVTTISANLQIFLAKNVKKCRFAAFAGGFCAKKHKKKETSV